VLQVTVVCVPVPVPVPAGGEEELRFAFPRGNTAPAHRIYADSTRSKPGVTGIGNGNGDGIGNDYVGTAKGGAVG